MPRFESPLNNIRIASPCSANWTEMFGNERKRFCGECKLNVYNLSGMSAQDAEDLVRNSEGRLCVRFYRRADGSVITQNCPVGWAKVKQRARVFATAAFSVIIGLLTGLMFVSGFSRQKKAVEIGTLIPFATPTPKYVPLMGAVAPKHYDGLVMGNVAMPTPTPKQKPQPTPKNQNEMIMGKMVAPDAKRPDSNESL
ncbi:MAG: hypothetical protein ACRD43_07560 [Pyrinomonadaceae bacterium]